MNDHNNKRHLANRKEMADVLGVKPSWLTRKVRQKEIPFIRLPGSNYLRFDVEAVLASLKGGEGDIG